MKKSIILFCLVCFLLGTSSIYGQWDAKITFGETTGNDLGLAEFNGVLYLAWQGRNSLKYLNIMNSDLYGWNFGNKKTLSNFTSSSSIGVSCAKGTGYYDDYLVIAYAKRGSNTLSLALSADGTNWSAYHYLIHLASTPAISEGSGGDNAYVGITDINLLGHNSPRLYRITNNFGSAVRDCFYGFCVGDSEEYVHLRDGVALATNDNTIRAMTWNSIGGLDRQIWHCDSFQWTPLYRIFPNIIHTSYKGPRIVVDPETGDRWIAWLSSDDSNHINIMNIDTGWHDVSSDTSPNSPTVAYFNDRIYVAWRGSNNHKVNVAYIQIR